MKREFQLAGIVAIALAAGLLAEPALAQRGRGQRLKKRPPAGEQVRPPQPQTSPPQTPPAGEQQGAGVRGQAFVPGRGMGAAGVPPQWLERLHQMPPEEQERFMNNNQRFRNLPAERQAEIRERLRRWNSMTPTQQEEMRRRQRILAAMTPEERRRVREEILPRWQQLPQERRQGIMRRLRVLHDLTDEERDARLRDEAFLQGLSSEDRELLRELARLRLGSPPENSQDNPPPIEN